MDTQQLLRLWMFLYILIFTTVEGKEATVTNDGTVTAEADGDGTTAGSKLAERLLSEHPTLLSEKDALDIGTLLASASNDPDTVVLIQRLKYGSGQADLEDLKKEQAPEQIVQGLQQTMAQLKLLEILFNRDPAEALAQLEKDGLVPEEHLPEYREKPELLEQDMRRAYYFSFVSLAVAGDYL